MRGAAVLVLSLAVATRAVNVWEDGKEYVYTQESAYHVGTSDYTANAGGWRTKAEVRIQVKGTTLKVKVSNLRRATFNLPYPEGQWPYRNVNETVSTYLPVSDYVDAPFSFTLQKGLVTKMEVPKSAPVWLQNMMRAFASSIQLDLNYMDSAEREWTTKEKSIHGECYLQYTYENNENVDYAIVTKGVDHLSHCVNRRYRYYTNMNGHSCNADPEMEHKYLKKIFKHIDEPMEAKNYASGMIQVYTPTEPLFSEATSRFYLMPTGGNGNYRIEKLFTFGNVIVQPFSDEGASYISISNSTLILKEMKSSDDSISVSDPESSDNLEFQFEDGDRTWQTPVDLKAREHLFRMGYYIDEDQATLKQTFIYGLENFVKDLTTYKIQYHTSDEIEKLHREGIQRLFPMFYTLDYESLKSLKDNYINDKSEEGVTKSNIFTDMLSMAGTNPAAVLVKEMIIAKEFSSDFGAAKAITSVPFHIRKPNQELVKLYEELLDYGDCCADTFTKMAIPLAFAHLVRRTCELTTPHPNQEEENSENKYSQEKRDCVDMLLNPYADKFFRKFDELSADDYEELDHYMTIFYNMKWGKIYELLKPIAFGETTKHKENYALRTQAIFAMASGAHEHGMVRESFMPLFMDTNENHEVRIAAFSMLVQGHVDSTMMSKITKAMVMEKDHEVFNYVYTAFEKYAENWNEPCKENLKELAAYFLKFWKQHMWMRPNYTFGVSKTYGKVFNKEKYGYSGSVEVHTVGSHKSTTPLSMMFDVRAQHFGHHTMQVFGGYIRIQGLAKRLVEKIRQMTIFNPQQWKVDELKNILFSEMKMRERPDEPVNIDLVFMFKDNVVFQRHYDESSVNPGGNLFKFFTDFVSLGQEYNINSQRGLMWGSILYEQPTELGAPLSFMAGYTSLASLQAKVTRGQDSGAFLRTIDYKIQIHSQALHSLSVFNPANRNIFAISQDRIYNHRFGSKITGVLNIAKSQVRLSWEQPDFGEPMTMLMHSQTKLSAMNDKITNNRQTELSTSCPTCQSDFVLSKGSSYKKERYFANIENEEWGFHFDGKYFDCEAEEAKSYGQMFTVAMEAFNPLSKQPHDLFTAMTMGIRQVNAFLLYYPKIESCGIGISYSQSKFNPVDTIDVTFTGQVKNINAPNVISNGQKYSVDGDIIFHGEVDRVHHFDLKFEYEPMMTKNELAFKLTRNPFRLSARDYPAYSICFDMNNRYPVDVYRQLDLDFSVDQKVKADLSLSWGQHSTCSNNPGRVQILGEHQTTEEGRKALKNKWYYRTCMEEKEAPEWKNGASSYPPTKACYYTMKDLYTLYQYKWNANFEGLEPWMVTGYRKLETLVKTGLFPFWKIDLDNSYSKKTDLIYSSSDDDVYSPSVMVKQVFHPQDDTMDLYIQTNRDKNIFKGIKYGLWDWNEEPYITWKESPSLFSSLRNARESTFYTTLMKHNLLGSCVASTKNIRTFDNVTYPYDMHNCWTLVSAHCSPNPSYAVFMRKSPKFANDVVPKMELEIRMGGHQVTMKPITHAKWEIKIDGQELNMDPRQTYYYPSNQKLSRNDQEEPAKYKFKIYRWDREYTVDAWMNSWVSFDGNSVKVVAPAHVKGQHCGMCGDFNGSPEHELIHPQMCELKTGTEMANAWVRDMNESTCPRRPECNFNEKLLSARQTK